MQDVLEGAAQYEVKELLTHLVSQKIVSLDDINDQIKNFLYAPLVVLNKPSVISVSTLNSPDHSLKRKGTCALVQFIVVL